MDYKPFTENPFGTSKDEEMIFMYSTIGLGCGCFIIFIIVIFILWKANYCNNFICCKKFRLYRELSRHLQQQAEQDRQNRLHQEEAALMQSHDNLQAVDLNAETNSTPTTSKLQWCFCCKKNKE